MAENGRVALIGWIEVFIGVVDKKLAWGRASSAFLEAASARRHRLCFGRKAHVLERERGGIPTVRPETRSICEARAELLCLGPDPFASHLCRAGVVQDGSISSNAHPASSARRHDREQQSVARLRDARFVRPSIRRGPCGQPHGYSTQRLERSRRSKRGWRHRHSRPKPAREARRPLSRLAREQHQPILRGAR